MKNKGLSRQEILFILSNLENRQVTENEKIEDLSHLSFRIYSYLNEELGASIDFRVFYLVPDSTVNDLINFIVNNYTGEANKADSNETNSKDCFNVIIAGKSGVGKSSFLNYLVGKDVFETGNGDPVTQSYFESTSFTSNGITYNMYDTKGIEPTSTTECQDQILQRIRQKDKSRNVFDWIHIVYYCFSAPSKRIEDFEIKFIKEILKDSSVVILLTKKDLVDEKTIEDLKKQINSQIGNVVQVIPVCSVEVQTRKSISHKDGREKVLSSSFLGLWDKIGRTLPNTTFKPVLSDVLSSNNGFSLDSMLKDSSNGDLNEGKKDINLDFLINYPKYFNTDNLNNTSEIMDCTTTAFVVLENRFTSIVYGKLRNKNDMIISDVRNFYKNLNGITPRGLFMHKTQEAIENLKKHSDKLRSLIAQVESLKVVVNENITDVRNCFIFDSSERYNVKSSFASFSEKVRKVSKEVYDVIGQYINAYSTELHQYGQDCIRDDSFVHTGGPIHKSSDLSKDEKQYYNLFKAAYKDRHISPEEQNLLDTLQQESNISDRRVEEIIHLVENGI